ncbi:S-layer protein [Bacillus mycoides]|uniref:S-layer homology domain-containing protein n=1 Tax=Bacillus mycoides TaxID=1405 RepID=UPI000BF9C3F0|nr:S-layer homology domain-containing protein [Bacillus mycoides]MED1381485.1 S-layer homology domain-containing protein [Bacillus mycoides]PFX92195.1 S-layer protein [Bacillus mycoides]QWH76918.1 S-layer homology domain-containing protein [Bacillus mycoides]QWI41968.1 S-layer homology domain-containing protein [Bacillus mycoides]
MAKTNSYKKLIAGTMTAAMVAGVVSPVAAAGKTFPDVPAGHWGIDSINYLAEKGAIAGNGTGMFEPEKEITRAEAATMMAKILNLPIDPNAKPSYTDAQEGWAAPIIAAVEKAGVVKGKGNGIFDPNGKIDRVSMAAMLVPAFKLDTKVTGTPETKFKDLETSWGKDKANILVELGISVGTGGQWEPDKILTKAEAAQFIAMTDKKFGQKEEAKVESIKAINAKEIEVKFGAEVKDVTAANFAISQEGMTFDAPKLSKDKKSVILTVAGDKKLENKEAYVLTVQNVKTVDGKDVPKKYEVIFFNDEVAPTVSTVSTPDGNVKVVFSEKLSADEVTVVINGKQIKATPVDNTVTLTKAQVQDVVKNGEEFNVIVTGAKDYTGNTMEMYEGKATYKVEKDVTAPEVKDVKVKELAKGNATLEVTFSEEMTNENLGTVTVKKGKETLVATISADAQDKTKAVVEVKDAFKADETATNLTVELVGYKDAANNVGQKVSKEVKVTKDVVAPNFVKAVADKEQSVAATFTFDKEVNAETAKFDKKVVRIINQDTSEDVTGQVTAAAVKDNKKAITLTFPAAGNYKVAASKGFIQDTAGNNSAAFTADVKVDKKDNVTPPEADKVAPKVTSAAFNKAENTLVVKFDKVVKGGQGAESASNVSNYTLAGAKLPEGTLITLSGDTATIELPKTFTFEKSETVKFTVANVANKDGVKMGTTNLLLDVVDTKAPEFKSAKVTNVEKQEVTLTFSEAVKVDATDLVFDLNGVPFTVAADSATKAKDSASKEVVLKLETAENVNFATGTLTLKTKELKDNATLNTVDTAANKLVAFKPVTVAR